MYSKVLSTLLLILGIVALIVFAHDSPAFSDGEATAVVRDWLRRTPGASENMTVVGGPVEEEWQEDYLGGGKWLVSRTQTFERQVESREDFEKWYDRWRQLDMNKLREYTDDLPAEDLSTLHLGLWTADPSDDLYERRKESWYLYEKSGLIVGSVITGEPAGE